MSPLSPRLSARALLRLDALSCAVLGATLLAAPGALGGFTGLPPALLAGAGLALLPIAAGLAWLARGAAVPRAGLALAGNALWVLASLALPLLGLVSPSAPGWVLLLGQAGFVALLAALEAAAAPAGLPA
ncbi:hypothetical protein [Pseudoroseomonas cervicalis]|uniref:hypothetical protein n=1 Tax=Teichococcus cervicalis TaxID=204525 RepID=UPI0022F1D9CD|nr:hypothetical protein [Pseudoroseomonas cervicalis]WBV44185.1 hypothetical protein PFY06_06385 [Pseudoroseomonas cervicalis]